ncbi:pilus assembly PilX family protein [Cupriavidus consociatus]|uniref:pilus assembly PilX family protein n=1 Tax=Cupriavidus consociatus TaxID=2821357 RepID=UPI001AE428DC|nr:MULTISPECIES: pilus assembly protein [unclassified Cupriavidus]MBP0621715.1 pilus assembly protein [Cupriavidus sp. LEh25]MDK2658390.1 pilus assembly protein [Cupriavidus sp. LEh21]
MGRQGSRPPLRRRRARGVVLVVALVILAVVSLLTVWSMRGSLFDERLAGNNRDHQVAFQAAELGLRFCEAVVITGQPAALFNRMYRKDMSAIVSAARPPVDSSGQLKLGYLDAGGRQFWEVPSNWDTGVNAEPNTNVIVIPASEGVTLREAAAAPRCFIEEIRKPSKVRNPQTGMPINIHYRVTALGTGINPGTQVTLQSEVRQ